MLFTGGSFIKVDYVRCLNYQHNDVGCDHCILHCPGQALELNQNKIHLDGDKCLGCGLCFSDCPTEVFSSEQWDEITILEEIKKQAYKVIQFFCGYNEAPFLSIEDKNKGAVQIPTCLSSVSKGAWYDFGLLTSIEFRLEKCHDCPMKQSLKRMKLAIETAMEWLAASKHSCEFYYIYNTKTDKKKTKRKAISAGLQVTSRRDLFLSLFNQGREVIQDTWKADHSLYATHRKRGEEESFLPSWQKRLEKSYILHFKEGGEPAYWPSIYKNGGCVNCGMCSSNCPTNALQIKLEDQTAIHTFISGHCLDCRICMLFCPTESIQRDRQPNAYPFETQIILEGPVIECGRCGEQVFPNEKKLCYWCKNEPLKSELISDVWEQLFGKNA